MKIIMDDDVIVISSDNESDNASSDDIQSENDSDNSESLLLPISPAKKVFTPTKRPTSDDSEFDGFDEGHGQRYSSCIATYDRSVSESENECVYANETGSNRCYKIQSILN